MAGEDGGDAGEKPRPLRDMEGGSGGDVGEKPPPREVAGDDGDDAVEKSPPLETTGEDGGGAGKKQSPPREMASGSGSAADEKPPPPRVDAGETALNGAVGKSASGKEKEADGAPGSSTGPVRARSKKSKPTWFTPVRLLIIFCVINMLNYVDRGTIASNGVNGTRKTCKPDGTCTDGTGVQGAFNLDNFQDGVLSSAFMVGLLVASPIFASLAKSCNPFRLIGVGLTIWTLATAGCGFSFNYWAITVCRMFVGVGEASFISLAAPFIDDNAPPEKKTAWLAIFYMCIPTGIALGYVYGGLVGNHLSWRAAFWGESILMLPFAILGFTIKPLRLKGFASSLPETCSVSEEVQVPQGEIQQAANGHLPPKQEEIGTKESKFSIMDLARKGLDQILMFLKDLRALLSENVFIVNVLGYIAYNFVLGAYSYWGPKAGYAIYHMGNSDLMFGGLTIVCGIFGTLAGGFILDRMHSTIPNAFKLLSGATLLGAVFCFTAFCMKSLYGFLALFAIGELLVFATQGPVNYVCLHCVKPSMRPLSMAMSTVAIHIFGDVPSSPLVGVLQDHLNNWRKSVLILTSILFLASGLWCIGIFLPSVDRFNEEEDIDDDEEVEVDSSTKQQKQKPALQDGHNAA